MKLFFKPTIQNKMLTAILPLLIFQVVIVGGITLFFVLQEFNLNVNQYNQQRENDLFTLIENPDILNYVQNLHYGLEDEAGIYKSNLEALFNRLIQRTSNDKGHIYKKIVFIDSNGNEIAKSYSDNQPVKRINVSSESYFLKAKASKPDQVFIVFMDKDVRLMYTPIYLDVDGDGQVTFSGVLLTEYIYSVEDFVKAAIFSFIMTMFLVLIGIAIIYSTIRVVKKLIEPIQDLVEATKSLSAGNLNAKAKVLSEDEIGQLAESFNRMADDLHRNISELEEYKSILEEKVAQRTQQLEKSNIELTKAYEQLKSTQAQLVHSEKMASLGQLVAGVAHELNNPINFIYGNMPHLSNYINDLKLILDEYSNIQLADPDKLNIDRIKEDINWEFLLDDLELLIKDCSNGAKRTKQIVQDLKNFSRIGEAEIKYADIHEGIDSTLNLLSVSYKNKIKVTKNYGDLPKIKCFPDQLNQVFMNLLANAAQAMPKSLTDSGEAHVLITTSLAGKDVTISIKDNASGIPAENLSKIFDPFFTTKDVGEGTGLGLSITYGIIEKHHGSVTVESVLGEGTNFIIVLPVDHEELK